MDLSYRDIDIALNNGLINLIPNPYGRGNVVPNWRFKLSSI